MQRRTSMSSRPKAEHSVDVDPDAETQSGLGLDASPTNLAAAGHAELGVHGASLAEHSVDVDPDAETQSGLGLGTPLPDLVAAGHADLGVHDAPQAEHDMKVAPDAETQAELGLGVQDMQVCMHALSRDHGDV